MVPIGGSVAIENMASGISVIIHNTNKLYTDYLK